MLLESIDPLAMFANIEIIERSRVKLIMLYREGALQFYTKQITLQNLK